MSVAILKSLGQAKQLDLETLQRALDCIIPSSLTQLWFTQDGAEFAPNEFKVPGLGGSSAIRFLIPLVDLLAVQHRLGFSNFQGYLPIMSAACGDYVCICIDRLSASYGQIYFFDHERAERVEDLAHLASDLHQFVDSLTTVSEPAKVDAIAPTVLKAWLDPSLKP